MSDYFEELREKAVEKARKKVKEVALNVLKLGKLSLEEIAECSGLTLERVRMLSTIL